jgi:hypothetical protein
MERMEGMEGGKPLYMGVFHTFHTFHTCSSRAHTRAYTRVRTHTRTHARARAHTHINSSMEGMEGMELAHQKGVSGFHTFHTFHTSGVFMRSISQIRTLFRLAAPVLSADEAWSEADLADLGAAIAGLHKAGDEAGLAYWAAFLDSRAGVAIEKQDAEHARHQAYLHKLVMAEVDASPRLQHAYYGRIQHG